MNRTMVWVAVSFTAGLYCAAVMPLFGAILAGVLLVLSVAAMRITGLYRFRAHLALAGGFVATGLFVWAVGHQRAIGDTLSAYIVLHPETEYALEGWVREAPLYYSGTEYMGFVLDVDRVMVDGEALPLSGGVLVRWSDPPFAIHAGERVALEGPLTYRLSPVNHGVRGYEDHLRSNGIHSAVRIKEAAVKKLAVRRWSPWYWASRLRHYEARLLKDSVPEKALPFVWTVWLGDRGELTREARQQFVESGTAHILAVSGVHVGIIFLTVSFLARVFVRSRRVRVVIVMGAVVLFALVTGARISTLRATMVVITYLLASAFDREPDAPTALSIAAMLLLLINPDSLFNVGFLLSFASVSSILIFVEQLDHLFERIPWWIRGNLATVLGVQLLSLPVAAHFFHVVPVVGPLANLIVVPLLMVTLWLSFLTTVCAAIYAPVGLLFGHALGAVVNAIHWLVEHASAQPISHRVVVSPTTVSVVFYFLGMLALYWALRYRAFRERNVLDAVALPVTPWFGLRLNSSYTARWRRYALCAVCLLGVSWLLWRPWGGVATVDFLDVGHGDAAFIRTPGGTTLLVDGGDSSEFVDWGARAVVPFLFSAGVAHLDYVIVSHVDRDHLGGLLHVVKMLEVGEVLMGPLATDRALEKDFLEVCRARGVPVRRLAQGDVLQLAGASLEVLHPARDWPAWEDEMNDASLVMRVTWPGMRVLFTGDIERDAELAVAQEDAAATILKVPHHGSRTSSSEALLDAVAPKYAVFSTVQVGKRQPIGYGVMERYAARDIETWRTDIAGGIRVRLEEGQLVIRGARFERGYAVRK